MLASEYKWSLTDILYKTYPEDFFLLSRQIKMRKIDEYLMQVSIVTNPTKDPEDAKKFVNELIDRRRFMRGEDKADESLDVAAFDKLRGTLEKESKMVKVK